MRDWVRTVAEKAERKMAANGRVGRRVNREKDLFTLRARHVKQLFSEIEALANAVNKELAEQAIRLQRALNPKNLGGIEVPDGARLALEFLERRLEVVVQPLASIGGRPAPLGPLATAWDSVRPLGSLGRRLVRSSLREDGRGSQVQRRGAGAGLAEKDMQHLIEWLVS